MRETHFQGAVAGCEDRESGLVWVGVGGGAWVDFRGSMNAWRW